MTSPEQMTAFLQALQHAGRSRDIITAAREEYLRGNEAEAFRTLREAIASIDAAEDVIKAAGLELVCAELLLGLGLTRVLCAAVLGSRGGDPPSTMN